MDQEAGQAQVRQPWIAKRQYLVFSERFFKARMVVDDFSIIEERGRKACVFQRETVKTVFRPLASRAHRVETRC